MRTYGLRRDEKKLIDLSDLDYQYNEWAKDDDKVGELTNPKLVAPKNKEFQAKLYSWKLRHQERK